MSLSQKVIRHIGIGVQQLAFRGHPPDQIRAADIGVERPFGRWQGQPGNLRDARNHLIAPPLEAAYGIDAALKAANVELATYIPAPSETNYSGAFLSGDQAACNAACAAFRDAVLQVSANPLAW